MIGQLSESELRALIPQLQSITEKYKRSERVQKALYHISELSSSIENYHKLFFEIHNVVGNFMPADNFFVAFVDPKTGNIQFPYFVDQLDEETIQSVNFEDIKNGITAHILKTGENLVLTQENYQSTIERHNIQQLGTAPSYLIGVPIVRQQEVIGAMVVQSYATDSQFSNDDLEILVFISQHIANARDRVVQRDITEALIESRTKQLLKANQSLEAEINQRMRMEKLQKALFEISELSTSGDKDIIGFYGQLHHTIKSIINAENCYIAQLDEKRQLLNFPYFVGNEDDSHDERKLNKGLTEYVIRLGKSCLIDKNKISQLIDDNEVDSQFVKRMMNEGNSWMGAPLVVDGQVKGVIAVQTYGQGDDYTPSDLALLQFVSRHVSTAIQRRESALQLKRYNQQLSEKVQERTAELRRTNISLKNQIEQRKEVELKLIHDAHHDGLTDLPNRVMFNGRLELALASKKRYPNHNFALLFIDLDRFKHINDTLGHYAGDEFLIEVASRIASCKRSHDLLARLGGDEFVVLVDNYKNIADVETIAQRIVDSISNPFKIEDKEVFSGASIGIAELTDQYNQADDVLRDADAAMYHAKNLGKNRFVLFTVSMRKQLINEINDEQDFRKAYFAGEFEYSLQAVTHLEDNSVLYEECTLNWPKLPSHYSRSNFWELANKCSLITPINRSIIDKAISLLKRYQKDPNLQNKKIGITLSIEFLLHKAHFEELIEHIQINDIDNERLLIQVSEGRLDSFSKQLPAVMQTLNQKGVSLILSDFASHSAALTNLFKYDFDYIKFDPNLVNTFGMSDKYYNLMRSMIKICDELDIKIIAPGVNDGMVKQELIEIGCRYGQGQFLEKSQTI